MWTIETWKAISQLVFHWSPLVIAVVGSGVAIWKFNLFREKQPAIQAKLSVYSRRCSQSLIAVAAEAAVTNTSRVKVDIRQCTWVVRKIAPYDNIAPDAEWEECWRYRQERFALEPGETDTLSIRGRVDDHVEAIDVILILDQPQKPRGPKSRHWVYRHPHNLERS